MTRWQLPISLSIALAFGAATLLAGCPEDPAEAMLKQVQANGGAPATPAATTPPATPPPSIPPAGGTPATPGKAGAPPATPPAGKRGLLPPAGKAGTPPPSTPPGGKPGTPPPGAPGTPPPGSPAGQRGAPPAMPPGTATDKAKPSGPKVTIEVKEIKAPYPRYSGKGRYDVTIDVAVKPSQDAGVWKISALDTDGKVVGTREEQFVLLREKPRTLMLDAFYCLRAPKSFKMELALDKDGKPKQATNAGEGAATEGNQGGQKGPGGLGNIGGAGGDRGSGGGSGAGGGSGSGGSGDSGGGSAPPPPPAGKGGA